MESVDESQTAEINLDSTNSHHENNNLPYIVVLCILIAVIISLTVGIIVVNSSTKDPTPEPTPESILTDETEPMPTEETELDQTIAEGYYPKDEQSEEAYTYDYNYLKNMIETKTASDGEPLSDDDVYFLQTVFVNLMLNYNNTEETFNYLNTISTINLDNEQLVTLYSLYSIYYDKIGNESEALEYINRITTLQNPNNIEENTYE